MDKHYNKLKNIFEKNMGIAKRSDIDEIGIPYRQLTKFIKNGTIIRLKRGVYQWLEGIDKDEMEILFELIPEAILCRESALLYHGYTDRTPHYLNIALKRDSNKSKAKLSYPLVKAYYLDPQYLDVGLMEGDINGISVRVYNKERTICDVLKYSNKLDQEIINKAIQAYVKDPEKNISLLIDYGNILRVSKKIQTQLGVWF